MDRKRAASRLHFLVGKNDQAAGDCPEVATMESNVQKSHDTRALGAWCPRLWSPRHHPELRSSLGMVGGSSASGRAGMLPRLTNLLDGRSGRNGVSSKEEIELSGRDLSGRDFSKGLDPPDKYARQTTLTGASLAPGSRAIRTLRLDRKEVS